MTYNAPIKATAHIKLTKLDAAGNIIEVKESEVPLTETEARELWHSQQQA